MKDGAGLICTNILTAMMYKSCYSGCLSHLCSSLTCTDLPTMPGLLFTASCSELDHGTNLARKNPVLTSWGWRLHVFSNLVDHSMCEGTGVCQHQELSQARGTDLIAATKFSQKLHFRTPLEHKKNTFQLSVTTTNNNQNYKYYDSRKP